MKKKALIILLALVLSFNLAIPSFAKTSTEQTTIYYQDIKISVNGEELIPRDSEGGIVEPFIIDGTTYLPVRAICEALGLDVTWDEQNNTIIIGQKENTINEDSTNQNLFQFLFDYIKANGFKQMANDTIYCYYGQEITDIGLLTFVMFPSDLEEIIYLTFMIEYKNSDKSDTVTLVIDSSLSGSYRCISNFDEISYNTRIDANAFTKNVNLTLSSEGKIVNNKNLSDKIVSALTLSLLALRDHVLEPNGYSLADLGFTSM